MPSVGMSLVGRKKCSNSARLAFGAVPRAVRSTAQSFVTIRLFTVRIGLTPAGNSAAMIPSASLLFSIIFAAPPSQLKVFASVFWKGVSLMSAAGTHTLVVPEVFRWDEKAGLHGMR